MDLSQRAEHYNVAFPGWPPLVTTDRWLYGVWMVGNNYRANSSLYGAYPPGYLKRVMAMFPDAMRILHLFSGSLPPGDYTRLDINPARTPDVVGNAANMPFPSQYFDLILADPPYSREDAKQYGFPMPNRLKVTRECARVLAPDGHLVWLDTVFPMYRKADLQLVGAIGLIRSTNHRVRSVFIFKRSQF